MPDNGEALALRRRARRRLVGAIAVVLALVIVPPWVMDLEPKPVVSNLNVEIPKQDSAGLRVSPPTPSVPGAQTAPPPRPSVEPREAPRPPDPSPAPSAPKRDASKAHQSKAESVARATTPTDAARKEAETKRAEAILNAEAYVIPLGTFASKENVKQLETKLAKASVKHYSETVVASGGEQTRVRAGPFATKETAETTRDKLKALGLDPGPVTAR
jgi:DedD protein